MLFLSNTDIPSSINNTLALGKTATYEIAILKANSIINKQNKYYLPGNHKQNKYYL